MLWLLHSAAMKSEYMKTATKVLDEVQKLKLEDLNTAFRKYTKSIRWLYLGDTSNLDEKVFTQVLE